MQKYLWMFALVTFCSDCNATFILIRVTWGLNHSIGKTCRAEFRWGISRALSLYSWGKTLPEQNALYVVQIWVVCKEFWCIRLSLSKHNFFLSFRIHCVAGTGIILNITRMWIIINITVNLKPVNFVLCIITRSSGGHVESKLKLQSHPSVFCLKPAVTSQSETTRGPCGVFIVTEVWVFPGRVIGKGSQLPGI